jgi:hypothetical protein
MHRHDLDLIAAYASGDLDDETRAQELIAACDVCRSEYSLHTAVLSGLTGLEQPLMTGAEKSSLHRDIWTELRAGAPSSPAAARRTAPLWYRWSAAAAGLFLVVGLLAVLTNRSADNGFESLGDDLTTNEPAAEDGGGRTSADAQGELDAGAVDTTAAAGSEEPLVPDGSPPSAGGEDASTYLASIEQFRESPPAPITSFSSAAVAEEAADCLEDAGLEGQRTIGEVDEDTPYLLVVPDDMPFEADSPITVVDSATCQVVHVDTPPE